jgi:hypothetical protein
MRCPWHAHDAATTWQTHARALTAQGAVKSPPRCRSATGPVPLAQSRADVGDPVLFQIAEAHSKGAIFEAEQAKGGRHKARIIAG